MLTVFTEPTCAAICDVVYETDNAGITPLEAARLAAPRLPGKLLAKGTSLTVVMTGGPRGWSEGPHVWRFAVSAGRIDVRGVADR